MSSFRCEAVKSPLFHPGADLESYVYEALRDKKVGEGSLIAITSKIVSLAEKSFIFRRDVANKRELVQKEAEIFLGDGGFGTTLTIKHGLFIASAGIDESNAEEDFYILFPKNPFASAQKLCEGLRRRFGIKNLGILITDSHTQPLRRGVTGITLAFWGFRATRPMIGHPDLFGRELKMTHINVADALSVAAVYMMGEANESRPIALLEDPSVEFCEGANPDELKIPWEDDLYRTLYEAALKAQKP